MQLDGEDLHARGVPACGDGSRGASGSVGVFGEGGFERGAIEQGLDGDRGLVEGGLIGKYFGHVGVLLLGGSDAGHVGGGEGVGGRGEFDFVDGGVGRAGGVFVQAGDAGGFVERGDLVVGRDGGDDFLVEVGEALGDGEAVLGKIGRGAPDFLFDAGGGAGDGVVGGVGGDLLVADLDARGLAEELHGEHGEEREAEKSGGELLGVLLERADSFELHGNVRGVGGSVGAKSEREEGDEGLVATIGRGAFGAAPATGRGLVGIRAGIGAGAGRRRRRGGGRCGTGGAGDLHTLDHA